MNVEIKDNKLIITMDLQTPQPSANGKTLVVASSRGNVKTTCMIDGKPITVGVNAYIPKGPKVSHEQFQRNPNSIPIVVNNGTVVDGIRVVDPNPPTDQWFAQRADGAKTGFYGTFHDLEDALFRETIVWKREPTESGKILGVVERSMPVIAGEADGQPCSLDFKLVCVSGAVGDYAVYVGAGSTEWIKDNGAKLCFEEASIHFPGLKKERYRGG